ncbi:hypothetical protein AGMMS49940_20530 [Spirochaetia bacterium]|nr:hypothetical protein AGMMS49940_20530 [Spirochaetia bacterium]
MVAGVSSVFSFLSFAMSSATQRFLSYELGRGNLKKYNEIFCMCMNIYALIALVSGILLETIGIWFINTKLIIPYNRMEAVNIVYQFTVFSFVISTINSVYIANVTSHERMEIFAGMSIVDVVLRLIIVFVLSLVSVDKLKLYGILLFIVVCVHAVLYQIICTKAFNECKYKIFWNSNLFREITGYIGWSIIGGIATVTRNQGINILLNMFFGPIVNAARGIAHQINSVIITFAQNIAEATRPGIIKLYAEENNAEMLSLAFYSTRIIYYLMLFLAVPLFLEAPFILKLWLNEVPEYTILFTRLLLIEAVIECLRYSIDGIIFATGNIRRFQIMISGALILVLPISYLFVKIGFPPQYPMIVGIFMSLAAFFLRLVIVRKVIKFPMKYFIENILLKIIIASILIVILPLIMSMVMPLGIAQFFIVGSTSVISWILIVYFYGLEKEEKNKVNQIILKFLWR